MDRRPIPPAASARPEAWPAARPVCRRPARRVGRRRGGLGCRRGRRPVPDAPDRRSTRTTWARGRGRQPCRARPVRWLGSGAVRDSLASRQATGGNETGTSAAFASRAPHARRRRSLLAAHALSITTILLAAISSRAFLAAGSNGTGSLGISLVWIPRPPWPPQSRGRPPRRWRGRAGAKGVAGSSSA
jgi:hypothetical protein